MKSRPGLLEAQFQQVAKRINGGVSVQAVTGLAGAAKWLMAAAIFRLTGRSQMIVTPDEKSAQAACDDLSFFLGEKRVFCYPSLEMISTDILSPGNGADLSRMNLLYRLLHDHPLILVVSLRGLIQRILPRKLYEARTICLAPGRTVDRDALVADLSAAGYQRVGLVEEKAQFAVRGNIVDIFPPVYENPRRIEFFDDEIELLRVFDVLSQRSSEKIGNLMVPPARSIILTEERRARAIHNIRDRADELEVPGSVRTKLAALLENGDLSLLNPLFTPLFYKPHPDFAEGSQAGEKSLPRSGMGVLFDYLPADSLVVLDDPPLLDEAQQQERNRQDRFSWKARQDGGFFLEPADFCLAQEELTEYCSFFQQLVIEGPSAGREGRRQVVNEEVTDFAGESLVGMRTELMAQGSREGLMKPLAEKIQNWREEGFLLIFVSPSPEETRRMSSLFTLHDLPHLVSTAGFFTEIDRCGDGREMIVLEGQISAGFVLPRQRLLVLSEQEVFGRKTRRRGHKQAREGFFLQSLSEMKEGDFAVHTDHGIGIYRGLQKLDCGGYENDYLLLEYLNADKLYLPVERMALIQRYLGPDGHEPKLDKLGGRSWETKREQVKKSLREIAQELVTLYASREVARRKPFSPADALYEEFISTFEYQETPDQIRAIEEVETDMDQEKPMDRLICGDAGFGKTEVALRAAFRAVMDGKQTVVLAPTTILAEQHYQNFLRRLQRFPVRVESLTRFKSPSRQRETIRDLEKGMVDIIVGTHRLLQKDVKFKELGLVVIDEEQKFGVAHKEKLKQMRAKVDVLTLSATPIPRTLQLSLVGIRDLSIIATPPEGRQPIRTYVLEFSEELIREAIVEERERGGQIFFVHNRIQSIYSVSRLIEKLVPEARIVVVHGRMSPREIEDEMGRFLRREADVLVCTSIIGSGIDIPSANCIIVNRADHFGLSQLYQIRGRVGRADREARAYLFVPKGVLLSDGARKRLQAITELNRPGSGFKIAGSDLENRGAGNLLGTSQSGHVSQVGYEHYLELLEKVVHEMKGDDAPDREEANPEIDLGIPAFLPESYVDDTRQRLTIYKRISLAADGEELGSLREELRDRYGPLPTETDNLLNLIDIRNDLKRVNGKKMGYDGKNIYLFFHGASKVPPERLIALAGKKGGKLKFTPDHRLYLAAPQLAAPDIIKEAAGLIRALSG